MQLETSDTQHDENLKPGKWMWKELMEEQRKDLLVFTSKRMMTNFAKVEMYILIQMLLKL